MRRFSREVAMYLAEVCRADRYTLPLPSPSIDQTELVEAAAHHRVIGLLDDVLPENTELKAVVVEQLKLTAATQLITAIDLGWLREFLGTSVPWIVLKGPAVAACYETATHRPFDDLDVFVPRRHFSAVVNALRHAPGVTFYDANWPLVRTAGMGELHFVLPHGTPLDLHWDLLSKRALRDQFSISSCSLMESTQLMQTEFGKITTLGVSDLLAHLAVHAGTSGGNRLYWYVDLKKVIEQSAVDWQDVVETARRWRARVMIGTMLWRAREVAGAAVRSDVIDECMESRTWRRLSFCTQRLSPVARSTGGASLTRVVARSGRDGLGGSAHELLLRSLAHGLQGRLAPLRRPQETVSPEALGVSAGSEQDLATFLVDVASGS